MNCAAEPPPIDTRKLWISERSGCGIHDPVVVCVQKNEGPLQRISFFSLFYYKRPAGKLEYCRIAAPSNLSGRRLKPLPL